MKIDQFLSAVSTHFVLMNIHKFIVVVRWDRGSQEYENVVSLDVTAVDHCYITVQLVYSDGSSDRWGNCRGVKVRHS